MKNNFIAFKHIFIQLNYILDEKQKRKSTMVLLCMLVSSGMELLGISAIYPFLQMMLDANTIREKWYFQWINSFFPNISIQTLLIFMCLFIMLIYLIKNLFLIFSAYIQNSYASRLQEQISVKVLDAYLRRPYEFFLNTNSSIIIRGIGTDVAGVYQILLYCFTIFAEVANVVVLGIFLFVTDPVIATGAMILALICFGIIIFGFKGKMKRAGQDMRQATALKNKYSYQAITGIKEITVLDRRKNFINQYGKAAKEAAQASVINGFVSACPDRILEGVCIAGFMGIVCVEICFTKNLNSFIPILGTFAIGAFRILPSISKISSRLNAIVFYRPCLQSTYENIKEIKEHVNSNIGIVNSEDEKKQTDSSVDNVFFKDKVEIKNVCWRYANSKDNVLQDLSLTIHKGESVAFIGESGSGKTTLADIIMGLLKPQSGDVMMDGVDIFLIPHLWAKIVGYVPQSVFLIDDTIRSNVAFGLDKNFISDEKVWAALEQARLKEFVQGLPYGLDTIVGERGVKFSGGQRQRVAIARALYENPDILILDEATSALDNETETAVMESIDALQGSKTLIIVAHRLTTIRNCDRIYEFRNGMVLERKKEEII